MHLVIMMQGELGSCASGWYSCIWYTVFNYWYIWCLVHCVLSLILGTYYTVSKAWYIWCLVLDILSPILHIRYVVHNLVLVKW